LRLIARQLHVPCCAVTGRVTTLAEFLLSSGAVGRRPGSSVTASALALALSLCACGKELDVEPATLELLGTTPKVSLTVEPADDFVYITVNGVRRAVVAHARVAEPDVTSWFFAGQNSVRIQAFNSAGPATYAAIDGRTLIDERCSAVPCDGSAQRDGLVFDRTYVISLPRLPAASQLTVTGTEGGHIYLNDAYTAKSVPSTLTLPKGRYQVGVGTGAAYYEQQLELSAAPTSVSPPRLAAVNVTQLAILPIRTTYHGSSAAADTGILADADVEVLRGQAEATSSDWVLPFSYGLTRWEVSVLSVVENAALQRDAAADSGPDTDRLLREAGLTDLPQRFDSIIYLYSELTADGQPVQHQPCCFWGTGQMVAFQNGQLRGGSASEPNVFLLHEMLHDFESFQTTRLGFYDGLAGAHGAELHGYPRGADGDVDYLAFYRAFMRGQVAEVAAMREDTAWTGARPTAADAWVGVFESMRQGVSW
jgi:hypothetical protein